MAAKQKTEPISPKAADATAAFAAMPLSKAPVSLLPAGPGLKLLVLTSGAVLMGLEIVGSRILAPYFGNSVFVWGSLISLFLIALSVGYYIGGGVSDRYPSRALLNAIILVVAALMFLIVVIGQPVCDAVLRANFGEKSGPFLAGAILFLLPSIGMGMVSPFAIRLATATVASVGKTSGTLYALSTLGSILGTMLTTFVLIPNFGAGAILKGLAGALAIVAVGTFPFGSGGSAVRGSVAVLVAAAAGVFGLGDLRAASLPVGSELVREVNTPYHHISVIDNKVEGQRELKFDRFTESSIELSEPYRSRRGYYTTYFHLAFLPQPKIRRALFIGAGGGVGPRAFHQHDPTMEIDVVDIDQAVLDVAVSEFHMPQGDAVRAIAADGRTFVRNSPDGHYDAIFLDAFTIGGRIPFHLVTREFFQLCRQKLAPGGVFVMNINSAVRGKNAEIFESMYTTLSEAFPQVHAFAIGKQMGLTDQSTNVMLVAVNSDQPMSAEDWLAKAAEYESASYVGNAEVRRMIGDLLTTIPEMKQATPFTDDYAPIETMSF
jgi:spermidine synthase